MNVLFYHDKICEAHYPGRGHPECPERLTAIVDELSASDLSRRLNWVKPAPAEKALLLLIHGESYVDRVLSTKGRSYLFDSDTRTCRESVDAALAAVGAVVGAVDKVLGHPETTAFCAVRPPGHHAEAERAMGFCLFNNAAIGAAYAIAVKGLKRVLVFDPDVHHGNGTQNAFYHRRDVFYASIHQYPFYPGTGSWKENGSGEGEGFTANFPLPAGMGDSEYTYLGETILTEIVARYCPEIILFSAGFDAHDRDPLGEMHVSSRGFLQLYAPILREAQRQHIPYLFVLEGGYSLSALKESVSSLLRALLDDHLPDPVHPQPNAAVEQLVAAVRPRLKLF